MYMYMCTCICMVGSGVQVCHGERDRGKGDIYMYNLYIVRGIGRGERVGGVKRDCCLTRTIGRSLGKRKKNGKQEYMCIVFLFFSTCLSLCIQTVVSTATVIVR